MYTSLLTLLACVSFSTSVFYTKSSLNAPRIVREDNTGDDPGSPLILTPLIEKNSIEEARNKSEVHHADFQGVKSYSGYFTVNKDYDSNLFFWFFPAEVAYEDAPVVLWLQGGPGGSSLFGLFAENGPFVFTGEDELTLRNYTWSKEQSVIFIDNPAGTGYSFTNADGYCKEQTQVGEELYESLRQFFLLFPELQNNDFFVTGESYAGKYVPAVAHTIHNKNPAAAVKINLKGIAIGDGYSDPINQNQYADFLYQIGLIDNNAKLEMQVDEEIMKAYIRAQLWLEAADIFDRLMGIYSKYSGATNYYNYLTETDPTDIHNVYLTKYVQRNDVRAALHVGNLTYHPIDDVYNALHEDMMKSVTPWISELLSYYRVLIYNGQVDIIVAYPITVDYLQNLDFSGRDSYKTAERNKWYVGTELAGYVKEAGNLTEVLVRNAGHMVPYDQPKWSYDLIYKFTRNQKLYV